MQQPDPSYEVIGAAIEVHREMGPGLLELVYQTCMEADLCLRGIKFEPQVRCPFVYKGRTLEEHYVLDLLFPGALVVEIKAVERIHPVHEAQLLTYLRLQRIHLGLLINFNVPVLKDGIKRIIL